MMLQPVGAAVEKAGGLPRLVIRLDDSGMDRKPSINVQHPSGESHDQELPSDDSDALLDLLGDEDDDSLLAASNDQSDNLNTGSFDAKLARLKEELLREQESNYEAVKDKIGSNTENGKSNTELDSNVYQNVNRDVYQNVNRDVYQNVNRDVYQNVNQDVHQNVNRDVYQNVNQDVYQNVNQNVYQNVNHRDVNGESACRTTELDSKVYQNVDRAVNKEGCDLASAPIFDTDTEFNLQDNLAYSSTLDTVRRAPLTDATPTSVNKSGGMNSRGCGNIYEDVDGTTNYPKEEKRDKSHEYEPLDDVFTKSPPAKEEDHTDGGMLSRQTGQQDDLKMEEMVVFKNLPPLMCTAHLGDEVAMSKLADTASSVLKEVVKDIHQSLGE